MTKEQHLLSSKGKQSDRIYQRKISCVNAIWLPLGTLPSDKGFKAKRIKDDLMFTKEDILTVSISNNAFQEVFQVLFEMEDSCNGER